MFMSSMLLLGENDWVWPVLIGGGIFVVIFLGILGIVALVYGKIWFQAYMSSADVSLLSLIGMGLVSGPSPRQWIMP